jgi:D-3-phosphoglycerate dehydrogenase
MHNKKWEKRIGFSLSCSKILFLGYGRIGKKFAELLRIFNPEILICDPNLSSTSLINRERMVSFEEGLYEADIITLHASGNQIILNENAFYKMQKGMILLNSARGGLIDENALVQALENGIISAAWIDTFSNEPYAGPLSDYNQVLLTPHISTYTKECRRQMEEEAVMNLLRDLGINK